MDRAATKNVSFLMLTSIESSYTEQLEFTTTLLRIAEQAVMARRDGVLSLVLDRLRSLQLPEDVSCLVDYYEGMRVKLLGHSAEALQLFDQVSNCRSPFARGRAMTSAGITLAGQGDWSEALRMLQEATKAGRPGDLIIKSAAQIGLSHYLSLDGSHIHSARLLQDLLPVMRSLAPLYPIWYCDYLNNLAYEWASIGRREDALRAITIAIRSPFSAAYPEWKETLEEIVDPKSEEKRSPASSNVLDFASSSRHERLSPSQQLRKELITTLANDPHIPYARLLFIKRVLSEPQDGPHKEKLQEYYSKRLRIAQK